MAIDNDSSEPEIGPSSASDDGTDETSRARAGLSPESQQALKQLSGALAAMRPTAQVLETLRIAQNTKLSAANDSLGFYRQLAENLNASMAPYATTAALAHKLNSRLFGELGHLHQALEVHRRLWQELQPNLRPIQQALDQQRLHRWGKVFDALRPIRTDLEFARQLHRQIDWPYANLDPDVVRALQMSSIPTDRYRSLSESLSKSTRELASNNWKELLASDAKALRRLTSDLNQFHDPTILRLETQAESFIGGLPEPTIQSEPQAVLVANTRQYDQILEILSQFPEERYNLNPREFEYIIGELFLRLGYDVEVTQQSNDGGKDVIATKTDFGGRQLILIECKRYAPNETVGRRIVQQLYGVVAGTDASQGLVVTTSHFTKPAEEWAAGKPNHIQLRSGQEFIDLVRSVRTKGA